MVGFFVSNYLSFCARTRIIFFFFTRFDGKNSSSCGLFQEAFNIALFNFVSSVSLDDFLNTSEGFFEAVERGGVDHLFLDASGIGTP